MKIRKKNSENLKKHNMLDIWLMVVHGQKRSRNSELKKGGACQARKQIEREGTTPQDNRTVFEVSDE